MDFEIEPLTAVSARIGHNARLSGSSLFVAHGEPNGVTCIDVDSLEGFPVPSTDDDTFRFALDGAHLLLCQPWRSRVVRVNIEGGLSEIVVNDARGVANVVRVGEWYAWHRELDGVNTVFARADSGRAPIEVTDSVGAVIGMDGDSRGVVFVANAHEAFSGGVFFAPWGEKAIPLARGYRHCKRVQLHGDEVLFAGVTDGTNGKPEDGLWSIPLHGGAPTRLVNAFDVRGFYRHSDGAIVGASFDGKLWRQLPGKRKQSLGKLWRKVSDAVADERFLYVVTYQTQAGTVGDRIRMSCVLRVRWR